MGTKKSSNLTIFPLIRRLRIGFWLRRGITILGLVSLTVMIVIFSLDRWVSWKAQDQIINNPQQLPHFQVAVVLGTSKYLGRTLNAYYLHRIDAAIELYQQQKVTHFLLSGDNAHRSYNEPWTMKRDLLKAGVPDEVIYLDYAGFRTLDSIVRAKHIFDTDDFLIITQRFHCERALFIAKHHNINATCLAVPGPSNASGFKVRLREVFARTKAFLDLYLFDTQPKFLGPKEPIILEKFIEEPISESPLN
ncbi:vancomycin high temperature exclusion protein [Vibrio cincinnatiensis]|jgi:SanA protein|uniref:SanA protein n=2 Tax=Vibrio cincinnatiensis TaxID=675 RepID=A0A1T4KD95_VIBCI|nr:ElyC/SanA/YdcF family protein [Vibrio cincinnatiensis]MCG3721938.1 vancomycin high temperature exclusion protein [Vibrio cincinnatiensis]MCG3724373.1 vancomycin high temperature exclusion protein [Vibrio cincinnatiensis]MCG3731248.1 vancomycin high temperature exclusion protein [Vibrio cincinnatiensis]MCG3735030.1 vancomycin high temperature exclusion protein [Vibrio cincinnatiensis]MCG3738761.1 vancomycin high temperature exclusion protein [Vibrio cincinnatiensis]